MEYFGIGGLGLQFASRNMSWNKLARERAETRWMTGGIESVEYVFLWISTEESVGLVSQLKLKYFDGRAWD